MRFESLRPAVVKTLGTMCFRKGKCVSVQWGLVGFAEALLCGVRP